MKRSLVAAAALVCLLAALGCTANRAYRKAQLAEQSGDWDQAVLYYLELTDRYPNRIAYRTALLRAKIRASQHHFEQAKRFHEVGALERALVEYQQAVQLDPTNQYARVELEKLREQMTLTEGDRSDAQTLQDLMDENRGSRPQPPVLNPRSAEPISLEFPQPVSIFDIYRSLGKAFGINVLFDPKLRDQQIAIELRDVVAQDALEILMRTANHFYKVVDEQSLIVVEDNPQNRRNYEDLVIQTFFLSNAEVKDVMTMLRSLVGAKNVASNDQLNAIVLRDTADKVKVAERIIQTNDKSRGEVVIDVELLQINTNKLRDIGVSLSDYSVTQTLDLDPVRASDLEFIDQGNWILNLPSFIYEFVKSSSEAQLLANPQLRISDGEQATLLIGERVPIPVTTFNTAQTVGGNIVPITSFQYQDIGIRLNIEPRIHHNRQVSLTLQVEVSNLSGFVEGAGGQQQPIIGTRTIESTIRLQNGETNFLAGLIRTDETESEIGVPGLSEIPVVGRLFSKKSTNKQRTDLVLTLTPHIVRTPDITEDDLLPIWVGTEANITFRGGSPRVESDVEGPFDEGAEDDAERIREMIRRRIQNLPRGLRGDEQQQEEEPSGIDLAPSTPPTDVFGQPDADGNEDGELQPMSLVIVPDTDGGEPAAAETALENVALETLAAVLDADPAAPGAEEEAIGDDEDEVADLFSDAALRAARPAVRQAAVAAPAAPPPPAAEEPELAVELVLHAPVVPIATGGEFVVELRARAGRAVSHLPLTLAFDGSRLAVVGVEAGDFLGGPGEAHVIADHSRPGRLVLGASRLGAAAGVSGEGVVARILFRAEAEGLARIDFARGRALDSRLGSIEPLSMRAAAVEVGGEVGPQPRRPVDDETP